MEHHRTEENDATEGLVGANTSRSAGGPTTRQIVDPDDETMCEAMHIALSAIHLDVAWHTGVITIEAAMESLHQEIVDAVSRCTWSNRTIGLEVSSRSSMPAAAMNRKTFCGSGNEYPLSRLLFGGD